MKFDINILTPQGSILFTQSIMVLLPAEDGEIGILPNHVPLLVNLQPGIIKVFKDESEIEYETFIFGGFAKFEKNVLNVLIEKNCDIKGLDPSRANKEMQKLEDELMSTDDMKKIEELFDAILLKRRIIENAHS